LTQANLDAADQQDYAHAVVEECDRITSRINQFLAFAKPCEPSPETIDPAEVIGQLTVLLHPDLENKDLKLECNVANPGATLQADPEMLRQALFNLIQNAIQFSPESQTVEISVAPGQDGTRRIEVADRGPGVAEDAVDSLFTPYFTTRSDGTGLGLAIVRRIAVAHGWQINYFPRPGGGAIFRLDRIRA
jgi:signal transduction histidine kinase